MVQHEGPASVFISRIPDGQDIASYDGSGEWQKIKTWGVEFRDEGASTFWLPIHQVRVGYIFTFNLLAFALHPSLTLGPFYFPLSPPCPINPPPAQGEPPNPDTNRQVPPPYRPNLAWGYQFVCSALPRMRTY
jgi:hypothetical protein